MNQYPSCSMQDQETPSWSSTVTGFTVKRKHCMTKEISGQAGNMVELCFVVICSWGHVQQSDQRARVGRKCYSCVRVCWLLSTTPVQ